jgi:hypothetical protein
MSNYEPPANATRVMEPHLRGIAGRIALDEALRRAVAAELGERIAELRQLSIECKAEEDGIAFGIGVDSAIDKLTDRLFQLTGGE